MTKRARTILFIVSLALFLLFAPLLIFYSQGYRIDFQPPEGGIKITQTGGIFLKAVPRQVQVYLDEKLKKKTDFFFGSALIENLLPKKYKVEVRKEGYFTWQKNLEVKEKKVTEAKNVILFPEDSNFIILAKEVENFWLSPNKKEVVSKEPGWSLKLYDLETNIKSHLINETDFFLTEADLLSLEFSEANPKEIYLEIGAREQLKYFTLTIDKIPPVLNEVTAPNPPSEDLVASQSFNGEQYYLDTSGNLFKDEEKLTGEPFPIEAETNYSLEIFSNFIFLRENQTLYRFNPDSKSFEHFFEGIKNLKISPDQKKLAYSSNYEILVLFLQEKTDPSQKKAGDKILIARLSKEIGDCFWINSDYLIFNSGELIKIAEIDERDQINIIDFANFKDPEILWNDLNKKLYILSNGNLYASEPLF